MRPSIIFEAVKVKISENVLKPMERVDAGLQDRNIYDPSLEWHSVGLYLSKIMQLSFSSQHFSNKQIGHLLL